MIIQKVKCPWLIVALFSSINAIAQGPADTLIALKGAIQLAETRYHLLQAAKYEAEAADKAVSVVKYSRLPVIDATYQTGLATANNLTGVFYPNGLLPMTGPPSATNNYSPATGSAAGILLNWQASTFGERNARIDFSAAEAHVQNAALRQEIFNHTINVISKYLDALLARDVVDIQQRNIERVQTNLKQSRVLANTGIKPGVDTALFLSELAKARVDWLNAKKQLRIQQWLLAQLLVTAALPVPADTGFLNKLPVPAPDDSSFTRHPVIQFGQSRLQLNYSKELLLKKSYLPRLTIWGTGFARGSGFLANGTIKTWEGLGLSRYNYGAGVQLAFPIMKYGEVRRQLQQQAFLTRAADERLKEDLSVLNVQQQIANTTFQSSITIAAETMQQQKSAQYAFNAMQIRYNTGLVNFVDLMQAQFNLLKAELNVKQAYWDAWKALLLQAAAKGDVNVFLNETR